MVEDDPGYRRSDAAPPAERRVRGRRARPGRDALQRDWRAPPLTFVLDLMLPEVNGLEICRSVRANEQTATIPIIMVTARAEESERIAGLDLALTTTWPKPFSPGELVARMRALLRRSARPAAVVDHCVWSAGRRQRATYGDGCRPAGVVDRQGNFSSCNTFLRNRGRVLSRDALLTDVGLQNYIGGTRGGRARSAPAREDSLLRGSARDRQAVRVSPARDCARPRVTSNHGLWRAPFSDKLFLATFATAFIALSVAGVLFAVTTRRQNQLLSRMTLRAEARLVADVLTQLRQLHLRPSTRRHWTPKRTAWDNR